MNKFLFIILLTFPYGCEGSKNKYIPIFDNVISCIEENYFDENYSGLNYDSLKMHYKQLISKCNNENNFIITINSMLFSFNVSHIGFGKTKEIKENVSPYIWYSRTTGIDARILNNEVIVTKNKMIKEIKIGDKLLEINNQSPKEIINKLVLRPPYNERNFKYLRTEEILKNLYGNTNGSVLLTFTRPFTGKKTVLVNLQKRKNGYFLFEGFPQVFLDYENTILNDSIGYISFNAFQPKSPENILKHIESYKILPKLIIDIRGNNGGSIDALKRISSELLKNTNSYYTIKNRNTNNRFEVVNEENYYKGNLVILIDELSISAAEIFCDLLQVTKSAIIIGTRTSGCVLSGEVFNISENYSLLLPVAEWIRNDGFRLENNGVTPDFIVELKTNDLLNSIDTQLKFAIDYLK